MFPVASPYVRWGLWAPVGHPHPHWPFIFFDSPGSSRGYVFGAFRALGQGLGGWGSSAGVAHPPFFQKGVFGARLPYCVSQVFWRFPGFRFLPLLSLGKMHHVSLITSLDNNADAQNLCNAQKSGFWRSVGRAVLARASAFSFFARPPKTSKNDRDQILKKM